MSLIVLNKPTTVKTTPMGILIGQSHPAGVQALLKQQVATARQAFPKPLEAAQGKTALVLGSTSFGYGSSTAIALKEAGFSRIIGMGLEKTGPVVKGDKVRRAPTGWYLTHGLHEQYPGQIRTYFANGFSDETRKCVIGDLEAEGTKIDLVLYSVAAPRREFGDMKWQSALRVIGEPLDMLGLSVDLKTNEASLSAQSLAAANPEEIENTRRVMGGEDLALWVSQMLYHGVLNEGVMVAAMSYIGPDFGPLRRIYWEGTLGGAKKDIDLTMVALQFILQRKLGGHALSVMAPAVVTQASAAVNGIMTYLALYLAAAARGAEVATYLRPINVGVDFTRALYGAGQPWQDMLDGQGRLRLDGFETAESTLQAINAGWEALKEGPATGMMAEGARRFAEEYWRLVGWNVEGVNYEEAVDFEVALTPDNGVINLLSGDEDEAATVEGASLVDAYFKAKFAAGIPGLDQDGETLTLTTRTSEAQQAFLADVTGNRAAFDKALLAASAEFAEALPLIYADAAEEITAAETKSVVHAKEVMYFLGPLPMALEERERRFKRRSARGPMVATNRVSYDESGKILTAGETTLYIGTNLSDAAPAKQPNPEELGEKVGEEAIISRKIDWFVEASGDDNILHRLRQAAQEMGLKNRVAHGMLGFALSDKFLHQSRPDLDPGRARKVTTQFAYFVYPEDTLSFYVKETAKGQLTSVLNQHGELVLTMTSEDLDEEGIEKVRTQMTKRGLAESA